MIRALLLDVDGTLIDSNYLHIEAWAQALAAVGRTTPRSVIHRHIGKGGDQFLPLFVDDPALREKADRIHSDLYEKTKKLAYPLPGAKEMLRAFDERKLTMVIASSAQPDEIAEHLETLEATRRVREMVTKKDVKRSKPAPDVFLRALEKSKVKPEEAIVLGDTLWDLEAATAAGVRCACVLTGGCWSRAELINAGAVVVYDDCRELLEAGFPDVPSLR